MFTSKSLVESYVTHAVAAANAVHPESVRAPIIAAINAQAVIAEKIGDSVTELLGLFADESATVVKATVDNLPKVPSTTK